MHFADRPKIVQLDRFDPTWPQHWNFGQQDKLAPTSAQLGSTMAQFGGHLGATSAQVEVHMASKWGHSRPNPKSAKHQFSIVVFTTFFAIDDASYESMFPMLCFRWAQLGAKLSPKGAKLRQVRTDLDKLGTVAPFTALTAFYRFFQRFLALMGGIWGGSCEAMLPTWGLSWAQLRRQIPQRTKLRMLSPTCTQTCAMLDPSWAQVGCEFGAS